MRTKPLGLVGAEPAFSGDVLSLPVKRHDYAVSVAFLRVCAGGLRED